MGNISINDPANDSILSKLQASSFEIAYIDSLLDTLSLDTQLYAKYNEHPKALRLFQGNEPTPTGRELLNQFEEAYAVYTTLPELRTYFDQGSAQEGKLGPRGQQFRGWLQQVNEIPIDNDLNLAYVAYELKPWHMSGKNFRWKQDAGDLRLASVDMLCRYQGQPVWCEVKMAGDTWTSSAVLQILFYGSCVCTSYQRRRLSRVFATEFDDARPWLAIIVERRQEQESEFLADFEQAVAFAQHELTCSLLNHHFNGMLFVIVSQIDKGWNVDRHVQVHW